MWKAYGVPDKLHKKKFTPGQPIARLQNIKDEEKPSEPPEITKVVMTPARQGPPPHFLILKLSTHYVLACALLLKFQL